MKKSVYCLLYWTPRVLAILFAIFISLFALDAFGKGSIILQAIGFLIHLIPTLLMLLILLIAWKFEAAGGFIFILMGISYMMTAKSIDAIIFISGPLFLIGLLFLLNHLIKKRGGEKMSCGMCGTRRKTCGSRKKTSKKKTTKKKTTKRKTTKKKTVKKKTKRKAVKKKRTKKKTTKKKTAKKKTAKKKSRKKKTTKRKR